MAVPARAGWRDDAKLVRKRIARGVAGGWLEPADAAVARSQLRESLAVFRRLPPARATPVADVLHDVATESAPYTRPRALTLFSTLRENARWFAAHASPPEGDVRALDGVVLRYVPAHGLVFHPLANFAQLNAEVSAHDPDADALADALVERAVPQQGALVWEYLFPYGGGRAPWTSGMAQAVAAQALARAGRLDAAAAAATAVPRLSLDLAAGPWIRLYSFSDSAVLNAQLQAALSLASYAVLAGDADAAERAQRMEDAARRLLPRFDTGYWSLYSLGGGDAPLGYHDYVIQLLRRLASSSDDPIWTATAARFLGYESEPPLLEPRGAGPLVVWPDPADGYLDSTTFGLWLSKRSTVTLRAGRFTETLVLDGGRHELTWAPGYARPGAYRPQVVAVDENGHRVALALPTVRVRADDTPPRVTVRVVGTRMIRWTAVDPGTPWIALAARLDHGRKHRRLELGRRPLAGHLRLRLPKGRWHVRLAVTNSAGKTAVVSLGFLPRGLHS